MDSRVGVFGIETDGFVQLTSGFVQMFCLGQRETKIVVRFRQVRVGHYRLAKFLKRMGAVVFAPIKQPEARVCLRVVRLQLQRFIEGRVSARCVIFALPSNTQIVVARWQRRTLLGGFLKERQGVVEPLLFQRIDALEDEELRLCQAGTELVQPTQVV